MVMSSPRSLPTKTFSAVTMPTFSLPTSMASTSLPSLGMLAGSASVANSNLMSSSSSAPIFSFGPSLSNTAVSPGVLSVNSMAPSPVPMSAPIRMLPNGSIVLSVNLGDRTIIFPEHQTGGQHILQNGSALSLPVQPALPAALVSDPVSTSQIKLSSGVTRSNQHIGQQALIDSHRHTPVIQSVTPLAPAVQSVAVPTPNQLPIMITPHPSSGAAPSMHQTGIQSVNQPESLADNSDKDLHLARHIPSLFVTTSNQDTVNVDSVRSVLGQNREMTSPQISHAAMDGLLSITKQPMPQTNPDISHQSHAIKPTYPLPSYTVHSNMLSHFSNSDDSFTPQNSLLRGQSSLNSLVNSVSVDSTSPVTRVTPHSSSIYAVSNITEGSDVVDSSLSYSSLLSNKSHVTDCHFIIEPVSSTGNVADHVMNVLPATSTQNQHASVSVTGTGDAHPASSPKQHVFSTDKELRASLHTAIPEIDKDSQNLSITQLSVIEMLLKNQSDGHLVNDLAPAGETSSTESARVQVSPTYCVECNESYRDGCPHHDCNYGHVEDMPILSRARMTLPASLTLTPSGQSDSSSRTGVWANDKISRKCRFGPLEGRAVSLIDGAKLADSPGMWQVFGDEQCLSLIDCQDENVGNWMMFVKKACSSSDQNVTAYQDGGNIYFVTCKDIEPGKELFYWYSKDYARLLGVSTKAEDSFRCTVCNKQFTNMKSVKQHLKYQHPDMSSRKFKCNLCCRGFTSTGKLQTHMLGHLGVKPHTCDVCNKQFTDQSNLRMHLSVHTGEKPFSCSICQRRFRQKAHLSSHMLTHTGERKLQCAYCDKFFARPSDLKQHEFQHTKEKLYTCTHPGCVKTFYKLQNYKKHIKIHIGIREFRCDRCSKMFYSKYHLDRHKKSCKGVVMTTKKMAVNKMALTEGATVSAQMKRKIQKRRLKNMNDSAD